MPTGKNPKVAVLMPVYYRERPDFMKESLQSIFEQTYQNFDLHLYQDGPFGEELSRLVESFGRRYPNLIVYKNP